MLMNMLVVIPLLPFQWHLRTFVKLGNMKTLLAPFEQLTGEISSSTVSAADVIPSVMALKRLLNKTSHTGCEQVIVTTMLDARYKDRYFGEDKKQGLLEMLDPAGQDRNWTQ